MKRIKSSGTKLEKNFSLLIHQAGLKYRSQPNLFGKPDFKIVNSKVIIFCDSSFWHGRRKNELNGNAFTRNKKLWIDKLQRNKKRAIGVNRKLKKDGWIEGERKIVSKVRMMIPSPAGFQGKTSSIMIHNRSIRTDLPHMHMKVRRSVRSKRPRRKISL